MPITHIKKLSSRTLLGRWSLTETVAELQNHPALPEQVKLPASITHEKRQGEWLASRILAYHLLRQLTSGFYVLENDATGRPFFKDGSCHVSISHTQNQVVVLVSEEYAVGIDVERIQPKVLRVKDKFLSELEQQAIGHDLTSLSIAWSAKETLYKLYGGKQITFIQNLILSPFQPARSGCLPALIQTATFRQKYTVYFELNDDTVLTYCLNNQPE